MPNLTPESLRDLLLPLLESTATAIGTHTWQAKSDLPEAASAANSSPLPDPASSTSATQSEDRLSAALTLSGALSGSLVLTLDRASAPHLFDPNPDPAEAWLSFARSVADRLCPSLSAVTGPVSLRDCHPADATLRLHPLLAPITLRSFDEHTALRIAVAVDDTLLTHFHPAANPSHTEDLPSQMTAPLHRVIDVPIAVTLRFGQRRLTLREVLDLNTGSLLELDRQVEEPVDLVLGDRVIARGEVMIIDGNYGMRVTEVLETSTAARASASALRYGNV